MTKPFHPCLYLGEPTGLFAERVRSLRANIMLQLKQGRKSYLVTSCWEGEGKSTVCLNLAAALAEFGLRVLLVDGDLRQRSLTRLLLPEAPGADLAVHTSDWIPKVSLVGAAACEEIGPADRLAAPGYRQSVQALFVGYDVVLVDSPPLSACSDALLLGRWVDGALLVTAQARFRGVAEGNFSEDLRESGVEVLGVVVTGVDPLRS